MHKKKSPVKGRRASVDLFALDWRHFCATIYLLGLMFFLLRTTMRDLRNSGRGLPREPWRSSASQRQADGACGGAPGRPRAPTAVAKRRQGAAGTAAHLGAANSASQRCPLFVSPRFQSLLSSGRGKKEGGQRGEKKGGNHWRKQAAPSAKPAPRCRWRPAFLVKSAHNVISHYTHLIIIRIVTKAFRDSVPLFLQEIARRLFVY